MQRQLSDQNYEKVLHFMQIKNQDNFERALKQLSFFQFDLNLALKPQAPHIRQQINEMDIINKYINFLQSKKAQSPSFLRLFFRKVKYLFEVIFRTLAKIILPQSLIITLLYPQFYSTYYKYLKLPMHKNGLRSLLLNTKHGGQKSVIVVISRKELMREYVDFLHNQQISKQINHSFNLVGYICGDKNLAIFNQLQNAPQIIICRMNIFEEVIIIRKFAQDEIATITVEGLHQYFLEGVKLRKKDKAVIKLYNKYRMRQLGLVDYESSSSEEEPEKAKIVHEEIQAQNQLYRAIEESQQRKKLQELKEQAPQDHQNEEIRKIRFMSIPNEPKEGKIIRFSFRCPNGATIMRSFQVEEKVQLIYSWVQLNDQIQFQQKGRVFEIMHSYPLKPLSPLKDHLIGDVFQDSQEKLVIREI